MIVRTLALVALGVGILLLSAQATEAIALAMEFNCATIQENVPLGECHSIGSALSLLQILAIGSAVAVPLTIGQIIGQIWR